MREEAFKIWLAESGAKSDSGRATRVQAVRTIENNLSMLGLSYTNLDAAWAADRFAHLRTRLEQMIDDYKAGGTEYRLLMPDAVKPTNRLASWRSWLRRYGQFLDAPQVGDQSIATRIRLYVLEHYIEPARAREEDSVTVRVKDVSEKLGLTQMSPNVCQALAGKIFSRMADVPTPERIGAKQSPATQFVYDLTGSKIDASELAFDHEPQHTANPTNLILYGPPGTGKTYETAFEAVRLCDSIGQEAAVESDREATMARYRELVKANRIAFVTFHQSYDYETFIEGMRPETADGAEGAGFRLEAQPGIFRKVCALAEQALTRVPGSDRHDAFNLEGRQFWKMSQGALREEDHVYENALADGCIALGWGGKEDWSDARFDSVEAIKAHWLSKERQDVEPSNWTQTSDFRNEMKVGDIVIVPSGNSAFRAVAEVIGPYEFDQAATDGYPHKRKVKWLLELEEPLPVDVIVQGNFAQRALYSLPTRRINFPALSRLLSGDDAPDATDGLHDIPEQFVLIIDEINRANISKVFGELITLIEPDKRVGMPNALTVTLPYSKLDFGVPANLHIVGTMNTADRSIAVLDTALRRRFMFREIAPDAQHLKTIDGIPLGNVLTIINDRVEYLLDREHRIGHAFFMRCRHRDDIDAVMRDRVIPLLQEYFFENWGRVQAVVGDGFIGKRMIKAPPGIDGDARESWFVRHAFTTNAYLRLLDGTALPDVAGHSKTPEAGTSSGVQDKAA